ncbi:LCP family glycopolymer transferase [Lactococcus lactis]|uniref:LCP family glycopolymer transferase n=1 Tax=Lactococcus lactis TaxID=1358 RepID=UPI001652B40B|nr:LCP family protein [Lactococcus lactis]QNL92858.1 LCP family protein [Lactococcus lactis]
MKKNKIRKKHTIRNSILVITALILITFGVVGATFYQTTKVNVSKTYAPLKNTANKGKTNKDIKNQKTLTFLIMGLDSRQSDLTGRTDTMMVVTLNPKTKTTTMVSIPRDTLISTNKETATAFNKINAAYVQGGVSSSISVVSNLVNINIEHYITMNFEGLKQLVDALGGITVNSDMAFKIDGMNFYEGENTISGKEALAYTRMRYDDPKGTYGRDRRQQEVIGAVLNKIKSPKSLTAYREILEALGGNVKTDLTWDQIKEILLNYNKAFKNINHDSLQGEGEMINNLSFQIISDSEKMRVHDLLQKQIN